jgi:hypothetical protein
MAMYIFIFNLLKFYTSPDTIFLKFHKNYESEFIFLLFIYINLNYFPDIERDKGGSGDGACGMWNGILDYDLDKCDVRSLGSLSLPTSSAVSEGDDLDQETVEEEVRYLYLFLVLYNLFNILTSSPT